LRARARGCRTVATLGGPVQLERPSGSCRSWRVGRSPCDAALGVVAGCHPLERHTAAAQLGTAVPYDTAQALWRALTGVPFGSARLHPVTNQMAQELPGWDGAPPPEERQRRVAPGAAGRRRPVGGLGLEGAYVPTRPDRAREPRPGPRGPRTRRALWRGPWRNATGCGCSLRDGDRRVHLRRWPPGHHARDRGEALQAGKDAGVLPEDRVRLCGVAAGAAWRGTPVHAWCPQARQGRDASPWAPDSSHSAPAHSGPSWQGLAWAEATMTRLSVGPVRAGLGGLRRRQPTSDDAAPALAHGWASLAAPRGRPNSRHLRHGGSPLGSGGLASSHKGSGHGRRKRSGAWWDAANSKQLLALRCAKEHGTRDQVVVRYQPRLRETSE
jgi:hypothetical protein